MIRPITYLLLMLNVLLAVSTARAFHADIFLTQKSGILITGRGASDPGQSGTPGPGIRYHVNEIAGLAPFVDLNPGLSAEDSGDSFYLGNSEYQPLPGNRSVGFDLKAFRIEDGPAANLFYWDGTDSVSFSPVANPHDFLEVRSSANGSAIATGVAEDVAGYDFTATVTTGFIHSHLIFDFDLDNSPVTPASTGVFLAGFEFNIDLTGDSEREIARPHYLALYNGPPGTVKTASMAAVNTYLDENFSQLRLLGDVSPLDTDNLPDDKVDAADIDALLAAIATQSSDPLFDLDGNYFVNAHDVDTLFDLLGTQYGDANLDGNVDGTDLGIWQANYGTSAGWAGGDFDGSVTVDGRDFLLWQRHYGNAAGMLASPLTIPEPTTIVSSLIGVVAITWRRSLRS
ncbi:hypothetical protein [Bythopirellula polymerisocia]|uniref:PEP-CTERM protein-sorting domain-containing protein n=1 Tax=Bythopirellula polymerisocia TaxID=2528003 RepID=A0A5C6CT79_9BACT|nr:hypothetical protein [Bythopirellula polymerisocia]TWU25949.1 hypothetical protein Pla144_31630 [Bythopirellula polymerisocia]